MAEMTAKKSILIADDEQGYRDLYTFVLEPLGFEVTCVKNGLEAVEKVQEKSYDLLLMDVHMPVMDGPHALEKIREQRPDQKFVIFSSSSDKDLTGEKQALESGALACLFKPVDMEELRTVLARTVGVAIQ